MDAKITKRPRSFKGYASFYNVEFLNSINPETQFKCTESAIINKLIHLFSGLKAFEIVTVLVLVFKKIEGDDKNNI